MTSCSPIALFVYNRPRHTKQVVEALKRNTLVQESDLLIFSDGPKDEANIDLVIQVRQYLKTITGFRSITIHESTVNQGLSTAIITGVSKALDIFDSIIVLEDDLVTSPHFLQFMNEALALYREDEQVVCINSYIYPTSESLPDSFLIKGADCQGWATWKRGWQTFNPNGKFLLRELKRKNLIREFNYDNSYSFSRILYYQQKGLTNSWAIRWYASAFLENKLTLYPGKSLVQNIGFDSSGSNSSNWDKKRYHTEAAAHPINLKKQPLEENKLARAVLARYFKKTKKPLVRKVKDKITSLLK